MTELVKSIKTQLSRYVSGDLKPEEFQRWFSDTFRVVQESKDAEAETLLHTVEWEFSDRQRGLSTDADLRNHLSELANEETPLASSEFHYLNFEENVVLSTEPLENCVQYYMSVALPPPDTRSTPLPPAEMKIPPAWMLPETSTIP